jgi:hypothetical protein
VYKNYSWPVLRLKLITATGNNVNQTLHPKLTNDLEKTNPQIDGKFPA